MSAERPPVDREAIRALVRQVLRDALPEAVRERIDKGIVTEKKVMAAAKAGKKLVVGKGVVLTPLARDKARQLGVEIERE